MNDYRKLHGALALAALLALGAPGIAGAQDAQIDTALQHARFAAKAEDVKGVHTHLQHVVNCLSGSGGLGFDANALNPCQDMGGGAIPAAKGSRKEKLEDALNEAIVGLNVKAYAPAHETAQAVAATLEEARGSR